MDGLGRRVRLRDVAERAGVSVKTVSNVVNGTGPVTTATRSRVEEALAALQYRPNVTARHLRAGRTGMVAVALPELTQPYFAEVASELVRAAQRRGLTVLLTQTDGDAATERAVLDGSALPIVDGLVLSPLTLAAEDLAVRRDRSPLVLLGEHVPDGTGVPHVAVDSVATARCAVDHLVDLGRGRIAAIGAPTSAGSGTASLRLDGYRAGLVTAGLAQDPLLVQRVAAFHRADGVAAMHRLLDLPEPPDAVLCFNDLLALGALRALRDRGLRSPDDVAVVGVDDVEEGRFSTPTLTTVAPDKAALAATALALLLDGVAGPPAPVPHRLVPRESTVGAMSVAGVPAVSAAP